MADNDSHYTAMVIYMADNDSHSVLVDRMTALVRLQVHHSIVGRIALNMVVSGCFGGLCGVVIAVFAQLRSRSTSINTNEMANCILGSLVAITGVCPYIDAPRVRITWNVCRQWRGLFGHSSMACYTGQSTIGWKIMAFVNKTIEFTVKFLAKSSRRVFME